MKLFHWTKEKHLTSIFNSGLSPNRIGIVYLTPNPQATKDFGEALLEVETGELKLTAFDDCKEWEVLCWGSIPPNKIKISENFNACFL